MSLLFHRQKQRNGRQLALPSAVHCWGCKIRSTIWVLFHPATNDLVSPLEEITTYFWVLTKWYQYFVKQNQQPVVEENKTLVHNQQDRKDLYIDWYIMLEWYNNIQFHNFSFFLEKLYYYTKHCLLRDNTILANEFNLKLSGNSQFIFGVKYINEVHDNFCPATQTFIHCCIFRKTLIPVL